MFRKQFCHWPSYANHWSIQKDPRKHHNIFSVVHLNNQQFDRSIQSAHLFRYLDYATLGVVIGHEIAHAFDSGTRREVLQAQHLHSNQSTSTTNELSWWPRHINTEYERRARCFAAQFNNYLITEIQEYVSMKKRNFFRYPVQFLTSVVRNIPIDQWQLDIGRKHL